MWSGRCALAILLLTAALVGPATALAGALAPAEPTATDKPTTVDAGAAQNRSVAHPQVTAAYPNPIASGDSGEYVVVALPRSLPAGNASLTDGQATVSLSGLPAGRVALSPTPDAARGVTDHPVHPAPGLGLANGGESIAVRVDGDPVHRVRYDDAPEGAVVTWNGSAVRWRPLGATDRPIARGGPDTARAFVLPDAAGLPERVLTTADRRLWLAGYTLTSVPVTQRLIAAHRRGADVRVLLEGEPIGGRTRAGARRLDRLASAGVTVRVVGGPYARYETHHAKYAVVDDRLLVLTENWKPAGTGGNDSRGWGVLLDDPALVENASATFAADAGWRDAIPWDRHRAGRRFERGEPAVGSYPTTHESARVEVNRTELLVAPDNAGRRLRGLLADADSSVDVLQVTLGGWDDPFAVGLRRAATRGVSVRLLLSRAWYVREDNRALVERFRDWADQRNAPLSARLAEPAGRFGKVHAKGAIVDDSVVLGSLNWNDYAAANNRELVVVLHGTDAAAYYRTVYDADWRGGGTSPLPVGVLVGVGGAVALAAAVIARIEFEGAA